MEVKVSGVISVVCHLCWSLMSAVNTWHGSFHEGTFTSLEGTAEMKQSIWRSHFNRHEGSTKDLSTNLKDDETLNMPLFMSFHSNHDPTTLPYTSKPEELIWCIQSQSHISFQFTGGDSEGLVNSYLFIWNIRTKILSYIRMTTLSLEIVKIASNRWDNEIQEIHRMLLFLSC